MRIQIRDPKTLIVYPARYPGWKNLESGRFLKPIRYGIEHFTQLHIERYGMRKKEIFSKAKIYQSPFDSLWNSPKKV